MTDLHSIGSESGSAEKMLAVAKTTGGPASSLAKIFGFKDKPLGIGHTYRQRDLDDKLGKNRVMMMDPPHVRADGALVSDVDTIPAVALSEQFKKDSIGVELRITPLGPMAFPTNSTELQSVKTADLVNCEGPRIELIPVKGNEAKVDVVLHVVRKRWPDLTKERYLGTLDVNTSIYSDTRKLFDGIGLRTQADFEMMPAQKFGR